MTKDPIAREGLARIGRILALDRSWKKKSAVEIKALRDEHSRAHRDAFFTWVDAEYERVRNQRGFLRTALGYAHRQRGPLTRFYDDGRLRLDNNASERELRRVAVGRKNWLFVGSDDHAQAAGDLLTLIASARLHSLDPEAYLRDLFRVLPYWPRERFLELCPRDWLATRARLDPAELECELGPLTVPELSPSSAEEAAAGRADRRSHAPTLATTRAGNTGFVQRLPSSHAATRDDSTDEQVQVRTRKQAASRTCRVEQHVTAIDAVRTIEQHLASCRREEPALPARHTDQDVIWRGAPVQLAKLLAAGHQAWPDRDVIDQRRDGLTRR